jgi:hypothetical protein
MKYRFINVLSHPDRKRSFQVHGSFWLIWGRHAGLLTRLTMPRVDYFCSHRRLLLFGLATGGQKIHSNIPLKLCDMPGA